MRNIFSGVILTLLTGLAASTGFAMQVNGGNATGVGAVVATETFDFMTDFNHSAAIGSMGNSFQVATFTGGFRLDQITISGTNTAQNGATFSSEADFVIFSAPGTTSPTGNGLIVQNGLPGSNSTAPLTFNATRLATFRNPSGSTFDSGGMFGVESFESFDDMPPGDTDSISSGVSLTFSQLDFEDSDFTASFGDVTSGNIFTAFGEVATVGSDTDGDGIADGITDTFAFSVTQNGLLDVFTNNSAGPGFFGTDLDTVVTVVDVATGAVVGTNDDFGGTTFSGLDDLALAAGNYEVQVSGFSNLSFGDYGLAVSFVAAVPEPGSAVVLLAGGLIVLVRRRRYS